MISNFIEMKGVSSAPQRSCNSWSLIEHRPDNHQRHEATIIEDLKAISFIFQPLTDSEMHEVSAFIMQCLISSIEDFITKTHVLKDMNILCELKVINDKIDKVIKDQMNSLNS